MPDPSSNGGGFFQPVWNLLDHALGAAQSRLDTFRAEAREEKVRWIEAFLLGAAVLALGGLALLLATIAILVFAWEAGFFAAIISLTVVYGTGAWIAYRLLRERLDQAPFPKTADRLNRDHDVVRSLN